MNAHFTPCLLECICHNLSENSQRSTAFQGHADLRESYSESPCPAIGTAIVWLDSVNSLDVRERRQKRHSKQISNTSPTSKCEGMNINHSYLNQNTMSGLDIPCLYSVRSLGFRHMISKVRKPLPALRTTLYMPIGSISTFPAHMAQFDSFSGSLFSTGQIYAHLSR